ncbi:MAG: hypothetical protein NWE89_15870 [Candidatus Bathyarchaeota archaeon]|nr:hypothetical protein [Candidatus Bathyarchaeota archaeon]
MIEDLRGSKEFRDSDFWIIGSDPNLDYYSDNFFDDKFSIPVNLSCIAYPESTFLYTSGQRELEWMISKYPGCLKKMILPLEHIPSGEEGIGRWENWGLEPIYMKPEDKPMMESVPDYESTVERIFSGGSCDFVLTRSSVHSAVFAAAVLGAKKIILVGCSHRTLKGETYASKRGMSDLVGGLIGRRQDFHYTRKHGGIVRLRRDAVHLVMAFKKYGIEIVRHRYDEDKNEFVFEEI